LAAGPSRDEGGDQREASQKADHQSSRFRVRVRPPGEARRPIVCDVYDETRNNLLGAKGSGTSGELRMTIGQLTDFARFQEPAPTLAVLVPARPRQDLEKLLAAARVSAVWPEGKGFVDNAGGRFS